MFNEILYWYIFAVLALIILFLLKKFYVGKRPHLPVLLYRKVSDNGYSDHETIPVANLEAQFNYLLQQGYSPVLLNDLIKYVYFEQPLPAKPVLVTFDGGYRHSYTIMYALLKKYGMKANIFLVPSFLQQENEPVSENGNEYLHLKDINDIDPQLVEFGFQSFDNKNYNQLSIEQINDDIVKSKELLRVMRVPFQLCLAFSQGAYPKLNPFKLRGLLNTLAKNKITLAFRIGNRLNSLPLNNPLLIQRIEVSGDASFDKFLKLLKPGWMF
jgi:peptidoglycan/xylan/chitin deacetylase (PgdA/CDA1 family)